MSLIPVILCGGSGTRLWPLSRGAYPKQFLALTGERTLLQDTALRLAHHDGTAPPLIVTNADHRFLVAEQLRQVGMAPQQIILEPVARNTAPAIAAAALVAQRADPDAVLLVLPSDHVIRQPDDFRALLPAARAAAGDGALVTFGIVPDAPHTGYGYIRRGRGRFTEGVFRVDAFVEKPDAKRADEFLASGDYYWNSGMFLFRADRFLDELGTHQPAMLKAVKAAVEQAKTDLDFLRLDPDAFGACPSDSIDYAVMERTAHATVIAADIGWSDIGSWSALAEVNPQDHAGNVMRGDVVTEDVSDCLIRAEQRMVAAVGVRDLVIVETADAVLVSHKDRVQEVKRIVERLAAAGRSETTFHRRVYRPWGSYEGIDQGERFQVKRIVVKPGASLSLQMHHHRAEHWIVVRGTARVTRDDDVFLLSENQSTYIPLGATHRLENPGMVPLELIEVQSGAYLGEDDIVRFEDTYGRK